MSDSLIDAEAVAANGRYRPMKPSATQQLPGHTLEGAVNFHLDAAADGKTLTMRMDHAGGTDLRGVSSTTHEHYLQVPQGKVVELTLNLVGDWDWKFGADAFTLGKKSHAERYWLVDAAAKSITLVIEPSGSAAQHSQQQGDSCDEKFNLTVEITQQLTAKPLIITIDPITKNPPPVDGMIVPQGQPVPIY